MNAVPPHLSAGSSPRVTTEKVVWWHEWMPGLFSFRISRPAGYDFVPGQFARLGVANDAGEMIWRAFSVASAPASDYLEFYAVVVEQGVFTPLIHQRRIGAEVRVEKPAQGFLTADRLWRGDEPKDLWMLSTGTGLGPFIAMLEDTEVWRRFDHLVVVHSVRHAAELGYRERLEALTRSPRSGGATLRYVPTLTRDPHTPLTQGRVTTLLQSGALAAAAGAAFDAARSRFMLCGNPAMVEESRALLKARGFTNDRKLTPGHIAVENYW
ncbi:MAG: ferredoxin--NADP reductase [Betaproteobacteria bacterium]|nr:ferredoxin--NADP reductase [Betaproteobacteria bacterium]